MGKKRSARTRHSDPEIDNAIVIGAELVAANHFEQKRLANAPSTKSPLPDQRYEFDPLDLLRLIPHPLDDKVASLCRRFVESDDHQRLAISAAISREEFYTLLNFSHRAAVFAIRRQKASWAVDGLAAVAMIEAARVDWRDILVALGVLHHAATRVGLDADELFRKMSSLAEPETAQLLYGFTTRPARDKKLAAWGFEEAETNKGIGLIYGGFRRTKPTYNLIAIASEIGACCAADKYQLSRVEFGTKMPQIWLESKDNTALATLQKAFRTGVTIGADLRPIQGVESAAQHLVVFLQEMKTEAAAHSLCDIARKKKPQWFCKLELAVGRLFYLLVARSYWQDIPAYETPESLARFAKPLGEILRRYAASSVVP
jgi:hypothetical protein